MTEIQRLRAEIARLQGELRRAREVESDTDTERRIARRNERLRRWAMLWMLYEQGATYKSIGGQLAKSKIKQYERELAMRMAKMPNDGTALTKRLGKSLGRPPPARYCMICPPDVPPMETREQERERTRAEIMFQLNPQKQKA